MTQIAIDMTTIVAGLLRIKSHSAGGRYSVSPDPTYRLDVKRSIVVLGICVLLLASCGGDDGSAPDELLVGIRASTDPTVGDSRLLFAVNEIGGERRGSPDEVVNIVAKPLDQPSRSIEAEAEFVWIVPDVSGLYLADVPFDVPGLWEIKFTISTGETTEPFLMDIQAEPLTVAIGEQAPRVKTPTLADAPLEDLTTDDEPLESLYESSLDDLLDNGRPTVVLFATPAFCTSAACGPLLDQTKALASTHPNADFIHIEVYEGFNKPGFAPDGDHLVPAVVDFGLPSEPWIFVMDDTGTVIARIEGVLAEGELDALLGTS